ncbi:MAG: DEAD/DEAH box helicase [Pseudomonadota bacterium]
MLESKQSKLFAAGNSSRLVSAQSGLAGWFAERMGEPTAIQQQAWPIVRAGQNALLLSQTGQGKSLAAWLPLVERTIAEQRAAGTLQVLHIAPLKALASDMTHNLKPLMLAASEALGREIRIEVRSGDTSAHERTRQLRKPPDYLATTPETLFILLGSSGGRSLLRYVHTVVVDEIHALAQSKRGAHLCLSLERLDALVQRPVQRIGLSATARPADCLARFLCGNQPCHIVRAELKQSPQVEIEALPSPLGPFPHHGHWQQVHDRLAELTHSLSNPSAGMLVFCATRRQVERTTTALAERLGVDQVGAHHGSLDRRHRESLERRFRQGELRVIVSSASLELGLDLGQIDRVCQLGGIGSINQLCQRAGRSGHRPGERPRVHIFPLNLNQWFEAEALSEALEDGEIEPTWPIESPQDVLAQHIVATVAAEPGQWNGERLLALCRQAGPWRTFDPMQLDQLLNMLCSQAVAGAGADSPQPLLTVDASGWLHAIDAAETLALANAGTIPEWFEYEVLNHANGQLLGKLDEEFAFESSVGDVVQLGNRPFRIVRTMPGRLWVAAVSSEDAQVPFWFGDGSGGPFNADLASSEASASGKARAVESGLTWIVEGTF